MALTELIKALDKDSKTNEFWWDILGGVQEARKIIARAFKENPTTEELYKLRNLIELEIENLPNIEQYNICLNELRKELIIINN